MSPVQRIKVAFVGGWLLCSLGWLASISISNASNSGQPQGAPRVAVSNKGQDYVGSEACQQCHNDQFVRFSETKHAKLAQASSWEGKVHGCESCHGPGRAHVEEAGNPLKINSFRNQTPKEISETCLACHAGSEEHSNFRRGEHWRNDVGCADCHSSHDPLVNSTEARSITFVKDASRQKPGTATLTMLRASEPQLCLKCHTEMKAQFSLPFHHKVLEGTMKCSDCHNPHGGFETKQTRLAVGADAGCVKCHTTHQGPFVFEHAPVKIEGCATCHTPHGASNPKLLKRNQVRQLCLECHSNIGTSVAPNTPNFHNQATVRFQNCTTCHSMIHGSQTNPFFFR